MRYLFVLLCSSACEGASVPSDAGKDIDASDGGGSAREVTILRDEYGVPHVFAPDREAAAYALGYTDGEDLGAQAIALLYIGTGRSSELIASCGPNCSTADLFVRAYRIDEAVDEGYASLSAETRAWLESYAAGVDAFLRASGAPPTETPTGAMVASALLYFRGTHAASETTRGLDGGGSNQLVITGARTAGETTFVVKDPHNTIQPFQRYTHLSIDGFDIFGNFGVGALGCGSNEAVGFGCTRAGTTPGVRVVGDSRYTGEHPAEGLCLPAPMYELFDHDAAGFTPLGMRCIESGALAEWVYDSRFGPVTTFGEDLDGDTHPDTAIVLHLFAVADITAVEMRVRAAFVETADEYLALFEGSTPPEDAQYRAFGDREHHIGGILGSTAPALDPALDWTRPVSSADPRIDGWTTRRDWSDLVGGRWHNIDGVPPELPHVVDPAGDFFLNCNGNPNFGTDPYDQFGAIPITLEREPGPTNREERMWELVHDASDLDADAIMRVVTDVRVPLVDRLIEAAECGVEALAIDPVTEWGDGGRLLMTLFAWDDYLATPSSTAATIAAIVEAAVPTLVYPDPGACLTREQLDVLTGTVLRDAVAPAMRTQYAELPDPLAVPWGYVNYTIIDGREVGLPGMVFNRLVTLLPSYFVPDSATGRADQTEPRLGSQLLQITSFGGERGLEMWILPPHGQIPEPIHPSSPHLGQTIDAYVARTPRSVWLDRADVEAHLCPFGGHEHAATTMLTVR